MSIYLCHEGHKHHSQDGATNCGYCKRNARKIIEARSTVSDIVQLLCDVKGLLLNNDTPSREARAKIVRAINAVLAQQHQ